MRKSVFIMHRYIFPRRLSLPEWRFRRLTAKRRSQLRLLPSVRSREKSDTRLLRGKIRHPSFAGEKPDTHLSRATCRRYGGRSYVPMPDSLEWRLRPRRSTERSLRARKVWDLTVQSDH